MDAFPATVQPAAWAGPEPIRIVYVPKLGLARLALVNAALIIVTLTIYRFWAKTNVRGHIWSCVHINGEPLEYTGTGGELFKGALVVLGFFGLPVFAIWAWIQIALDPYHYANYALQGGVFLVISVFWGMAVYRARRYQLSRTLWRGVRGTMAGSPLAFTWVYFGALLLRIISLGWSTPAMNLNIQQRMIGEMRFGSMPFRFEGKAGPLYGRFAACWFGALAALVIVVIALVWLIIDITNEYYFAPWILGPSIIFVLLFFFLIVPLVWGVVWSLYVARELSLFASYTSFDEARFSLDATASSLIALAVGNFFIYVLTLGFGDPFIQQRRVRYLCDRVAVAGQVNVDAIVQSRQALDKTGEGLADAFDVGGI